MTGDLKKKKSIFQLQDGEWQAWDHPGPDTQRPCLRERDREFMSVMIHPTDAVGWRWYDTCLWHRTQFSKEKKTICRLLVYNQISENDD